MTLPANIRINVKAPFPAFVTGTGIITVAKTNGIWMIGTNYANLAPLLNIGDLPASLVAIYDPVTQQFNTVTATQIAALASTLGVRTQRSITGSGSLPIVGTDSLLNISIAAPLAIPVPLASSRAGAPLTFKNLKSSTAAATLTVSGGDAFDTAPQWVLQPGDAVTLVPANDGINTGYMIE